MVCLASFNCPHRSLDPEYPLVCDICDKRLGDIESAALHALTDKHKRHLRYLQEADELSSSSLRVGQYDVMLQNAIQRSDSTSQFAKCLLCRSSLCDPYQVLTHVGSRRHRQNQEWYEKVQAAKALGKFATIRETEPRRTGIPYESESYELISPPAAFIISQEVADLIGNLPEGIIVREWDYFCQSCDCRLNTEDHVRSHIASAQHTGYGEGKKNGNGAWRGPKQRPLNVRDTDWGTAVKAGVIPPPPLNRRP